MKDLSKMKDSASSDTVLLSLHNTPTHPVASQLAQDWCRQQLGLNKVVHLWFMQNAVYHALQPEVDTGRSTDIYSGWKALADSGVKLFMCSAACRRRLPAGSVDEALFTRAGLTGWADQVLKLRASEQNEVVCIVDNDPGKSRFLSETIDPVHALLALDAKVRVIFTAQGRRHLLDTDCWRKWRMLPETENLVQLIAINTGLEPEEQEVLSSRPLITGVTAIRYQQICKQGYKIYV